MKIIEATLVLPITLLILISLIGIAMTFQNNLSNQIVKHEDDRAKIYSLRETTVIRTDRLVHQTSGEED